MAPAKKNAEPEGRHIVFNLRSIAYGLAWFFAFCFTVAELGLVSYELHTYGQTYDNYPSKGYKHALGLLLFAVIFSLLIILSHPWSGIGRTAFVALAAAVVFGVGAGLLRTLTPFRGTSCRDRTAEEYPLEWQPYASECKKVVSIQALAWALWALYILIMVGALAQKLSIRVRQTPEGFYYNGA